MHAAAAAAAAPGGRVRGTGQKRLVELFGGMGGVTLGAVEAGMVSLLWVGESPRAEAVHAARFPDCVHWRGALDVSGAFEAMSPAVAWDSVRSLCVARRVPLSQLHVHASPPCARRRSGGSDDADGGAELNAFADVGYDDDDEETGLEALLWTVNLFNELRAASDNITYTCDVAAADGVMAVLSRSGVHHRVLAAHELGARSICSRVVAGRWDPEAAAMRCAAAPPQALRAALDALPPGSLGDGDAQERLKRCALALRLYLQGFPPDYLDGMDIDPQCANEMVVDELPPPLARAFLCAVLTEEECRRCSL
ncbi:hypothetical protein JKP88DRAFT_247025 [Tribonema minus]|uniref:Uncharacterized protein n=1 Tax=Tribonema minus TaxID=303371 RepID=A0A835YV78_9STRA|nr:hypothetical protein JKP88DRAFT_247025 [Tribonema minus]